MKRRLHYPYEVGAVSITRVGSRRRDVRLESGATAKGWPLMVNTVVTAKSDTSVGSVSMCMFDGHAVDCATFPGDRTSGKGWVIVNAEGRTIIGRGSIRGDALFDAVWELERQLEDGEITG